MKQLIYALTFLLLATIPAVAKKQKSPNAISDNYEIFNFTYLSVDGKKNPVKVSARAYLPGGKVDLSHILLACHPTVTSNSETPTGINPVDGDIKRMCGETGNWLVVCPDYCGYGHSSYRQHPYLIHDVTARNCIDAVMEAIRNIKDKKWKTYVREDKDSPRILTPYELKGGYTTDIVGYSQGGATALACTRYLDGSSCPEDVKKTINLRHTCCGDGPYSLLSTMNKYVEWGDPTREDEGLDMEYPCVLPLILAAAKDAYADGCMRTVNVEDYFKPEFLEKTDIINLLESKTTSTADINAQIKEAWTGRLRPVDIFSSNLMNPDGTFKTDSKLYKCLMQAARLADLTQGWEPTTPITFAHLHADKVVPYANYEAINDGIGKNGKNELVKFVDIEQPHYYTDSSLMEWLAYWMKDLDGSPDFSTMSHASGGLVFYIHYLFGKGLRP